MNFHKIIKRFLDFIAALVALLILSPIFLFVFFCLLIVNNGKPFFFQERPGKNGKLFEIIKFKTMADYKAGSNVNIHSLSRVTKIGGFLRKYSLDEIPQLLNVLKGDMSLVGPRPLLTKYLPLYNNTQKKRHNVKPGITGWAQVKGRNSISWEQKFNFDLWYVENQSFNLDLKIIFLTIKRIIVPEGINNGGEVNMPEFTGSNTN